MAGHKKKKGPALHTAPPTYVTKSILAEKSELDLQRELEANRAKAAQKFDAKMLARSYTKEAVKTLVDVMMNEAAADSDRLTAAKLILERGHGRAPLTLEDGDGVKMPVVFLPVEVGEDRKTITVQALPAHTEPQAPVKRKKMDSVWAEERQLEEALAENEELRSEELRQRDYDEAEESDA